MTRVGASAIRWSVTLFLWINRLFKIFIVWSIIIIKLNVGNNLKKTHNECEKKNGYDLSKKFKRYKNIHYECPRCRKPGTSNKKSNRIIS